MAVKIITKYDYAERAKIAPGIDFDPKKDKSLTNQSDLEASDINNIMARFEKTGFIPGTDRRPMYGDFTEIADYHTQLSAIRRMETAFAALPAKIRNRFENDPQKLVDFLENPENNKEAVSLGLMPPPPPPPARPEDKLIKDPGKPGEPPAPAAPAAPAPPPAG